MTESKEDVLSGKAKVFIGSLKLETYDDLSKLKLKAITGDLRFRRKNAKGLENLTYVGGTAWFFFPQLLYFLHTDLSPPVPPAPFWPLKAL